MLSRNLKLRLGYRRGFPFITSVVLAIFITAWPRVREARFHEGTQMWLMAVLVAASTAVVWLCGGRFRTFFTALAVTPPFVLVLPMLLHSSIRHPDYPIKGFVEYFLYLVAGPIIVVWIAAKLFKSNKLGGPQTGQH